MKVFNEADFKRWFRAHWSGWVESYEPRRGSGTGIPDLQVLIGIDNRKVLLPIELKVGFVKDRVLFPREVRPAQISWHRRFAEAGGVSVLLVGALSAGHVTPCLVAGTKIAHWDFGYESSEHSVLDEDRLLELMQIAVQPMFR